MTRNDLKRRLGNVRAWVRRLWGALTDGMLDDWASTELQVRRQMRAPLQEYLSLARELDDLAFALLRQVTELRHPESVFRAHAALLVRVLQDLRVTTWSAQSGYTMQAWTVASSTFEAAHTMGFIGVDSARAAGWLAHKDLDRSFCSAKTGVEGSFKYLEIGRQGKQRVALVQHEYELYERLCMGKHVNPVAERTRYIGVRDGATRLTLTPYYSPRRAREARMGLILACRAATLAIWIFHKAHGGTSGTEGDRLIALAQRTAGLLDTWKMVDGQAPAPPAAPERAQSSPGA